MKISLEDVKNIVRKHITDENLLDSYLFHATRYFSSIQYIHKHGMDQGIIFEAGRDHIFSDILKLSNPDCQIVHTEYDLRRTIDIPSHTVDNIICMEVFEHITDIEGASEVHLHGVRNMLCEFHRVLKTGGNLFITTPNAASYDAIARIRNQKNPLSYVIHYREFSLEEMQAILERSGFVVQEIFSINAYNNKNNDKLKKQLAQLCFPVESMESTIFARVKKMQEMTLKPIDLAYLLLDVAKRTR